ncbi:16S rRNA (cytosine(1402)-N(4))-methyltransferase RsmH [Buchnera aphidicola]|uniref:16S rRNA (cytosine(1402)-N(4))-methyltransferase RsmH n=1 Tax=Buchnera aphidicola TaxID=9 RepID=UPI0031B866F7
MNNKKKHQTVLLKETIQSLKIKKNGIYVDGTFGEGGHSIKILEKLGENGTLYAIDQDPEAIKIAKKITDHRFHIIHGNFAEIDLFFKKNKIKKKIDGIILDLGVSTMQIMSKKRGFSFNLDGPLDMRMNPKIGISASKWINQEKINKIYKVLKYFGEEKFSKRIAEAIKKTRKKKPIITTLELSNLIKSHIPWEKRHKHPATKSFQAIRIFINQEINLLKIFLDKILKFLNYKGRISIISFHSLEDRLVKQFMIKNSKNPHFLNKIPLKENEILQLYQKKLKIIHRIFPTKKEIINNPRSRSAILRTAELKN